MSTTFGQLGLPESIVDSLARRGIDEPFPIQSDAIPDALRGRDICGKAPTGSGKTLAFGLAVLTRVDTASSRRPRALVLVPTRELADQIVRELRPIAKQVQRRVSAIYGGVGYTGQRKALRQGADVVVATPGRLEDLLDHGDIDLSEIDIAVVDEADRMADMGFLPAVRRILDRTPSDRQTLLFSATLDGDIAVLSRDYQREPVRHEAGSNDPDAAPATHHFWLVDPSERAGHVAGLVEAEGSSIVFTRTRHGADRLAKQLSRQGVTAVAMHGGRSQNQRNRALDAFTKGRAAALVATDVAARGIHVDDVAAVIHFDPAGDEKDYVHRSGRTARAGAGGKVITLVTDSTRGQVRGMARRLDLDVRFEKPTPGAPAPRPKGGRGNGASEGKQPSSKRQRAQSLYVANLPWRTTEEELRKAFSQFGQVHDTVIITDRKSGRSRGFGFVEMSGDAAPKAIERMNGSTFEGRSLTVRPARPSKHHG